MASRAFLSLALMLTTESAGFGNTSLEHRMLRGGMFEATFVAHVVRPFSKHKATEIVSAPNVYAFDTGFIAYQRGWKDMRPEDKGVLWEHLVLNEMHGRWQRRDIQYWRDKARREVDFVLAGRGRDPVAIGCKWTAERFEADAIAAFRKLHPKGRNRPVDQTGSADAVAPSLANGKTKVSRDRELFNR